MDVHVENTHHLLLLLLLLENDSHVQFVACWLGHIPFNWGYYV